MRYTGLIRTHFLKIFRARTNSHSQVVLRTTHTFAFAHSHCVARRHSSSRVPVFIMSNDEHKNVIDLTILSKLSRKQRMYASGETTRSTITLADKEEIIKLHNAGTSIDMIWSMKQFKGIAANTIRKYRSKDEQQKIFNAGVKCQLAPGTTAYNKHMSSRCKSTSIIFEALEEMEQTHISTSRLLTT